MLHKVVVDGYTMPISDLSSHEVAWELNNVEDFWVIDLNEQINKFIQWCVQGMFEFWSLKIDWFMRIYLGEKQLR